MITGDGFEDKLSFDGITTSLKSVSLQKIHIMSKTTYIKSKGTVQTNIFVNNLATLN